MGSVDPEGVRCLSIEKYRVQMPPSQEGILCVSLFGDSSSFIFAYEVAQKNEHKPRQESNWDQLRSCSQTPAQSRQLESKNSKMGG